MQATQVLRDEHEGILTMVTIVETAALRLQAGKPIPSDLMVNAADFFSGFVDKCHHGKEEGRLFPALVAHGIPDEGGPVGVMKAEHAHGREFIRAMRVAAEQYRDGDAGGIPALVENTVGYANLLRQHINKENQILFAMADQMIPAAEQGELAQFYDAFEAQVMGAGVHERYHAMIDEYQKLSAAWQ